MKKTEKRTRRGPKRDPALWEAYEWIERRTEVIAEREGRYGAVRKACAAYLLKFCGREQQTDADIDSLRKSIKNAADSLRKMERRIVIARANYRPVAGRKRK